MIEIIIVNEVVTTVTSAPEVIAALNIASEIIIVLHLSNIGKIYLCT